MPLSVAIFPVWLGALLGVGIALSYYGIRKIISAQPDIFSPESGLLDAFKAKNVRLVTKLVSVMKDISDCNTTRKPDYFCWHSNDRRRLIKYHLKSEGI